MKYSVGRMVFLGWACPAIAAAGVMHILKTLFDKINTTNPKIWRFHYTRLFSMIRISITGHFPKPELETCTISHSNHTLTGPCTFPSKCVSSKDCCVSIVTIWRQYQDEYNKEKATHIVTHCHQKTIFRVNSAPEKQIVKLTGVQNPYAHTEDVIPAYFPDCICTSHILFEKDCIRAKLIRE